MSQATIIGLPQPKSWEDFERGCRATFGGGYQTEAERDIFHHGMTTVFRLLEREFPPAEQCKAAPDLLAACKAALADLIASANDDGEVADALYAAIRKAEAANARLISAAPELLAALKDVCANVRTDDPDMWMRAYAAITKAEAANA